MSWFVYATLSAFLASLASIIEKRTLARVHSTDFSLLIALLVSLCSLPFFFIEPLEALTPKVIGTVYVVSLFGAFAFLEITKGVRHMEISASAPLFLISPFITALLAYIALGESLSRTQLVGMSLLAFGTYILETKRMSDFRGFLDHFFGNAYTRLIVLGLFFYAITSTIDRVILGEWGVPPMLVVGLAHLFIFCNFLVYFIWKKRPLRPLLNTLHSSWKSLTLVALLTIGYRVTYAYAVSLTAVALVIAIKRSSSLFTTVIGGQLFHDHALLRKSVACMIMLTGVALIALR